MLEIDLSECSKTFVSGCAGDNFGLWQEIVRRFGDPHLVFVDQSPEGMVVPGSIHYLLGNKAFENTAQYVTYGPLISVVARERDRMGKVFVFDPNQVYRKVLVDPIADYERAMKGI